jgi:hypothetical protein
VQRGQMRSEAANAALQVRHPEEGGGRGEATHNNRQSSCTGHDGDTLEIIIVRDSDVLH